MTLAALTFSDPLMLAGLLAALVPVALHLLNRVRAPVVPFPTLRFLKLTAEKTARRRQIQHYFLLLVRVIVFALVAMAVASPLIHGGSPALAYALVAMLLGGLALLMLGGILGASALDARKSRPSSARSAAPPKNAGIRGFAALAAIIAAICLGAFALMGLASDRFFSGDRGEFSGRSTAIAIIFDNSHSMLVTEESQTRLARAKAQIRQLLGQAIQPAEAAVLPTNPMDQAAPGLTADMTRLAGYLDSLTPRGSARPMQERIRAAIDLLARSSQPSKMLIIAGDFARPAFADAEVFAPLKNLSWRKDLQVVLMPIHGPDTADGLPDAGIASFAPAAGTQRPALGAEITFEAQIINNREVPDVKDVVLTVDGKPVEGAGPQTPRVTLGAGGTPTIVKIPYRFTQAGPHVFGLEIRGPQDAMTWDDKRELSLDVAEQVKVLVLGAEAPDARGMPRPRSAAFYLMAALAPYDTAGTAPVPWSIKPTYRAASQITDMNALRDDAAVFLCDVPKISNPLADSLAAYSSSTTGAGGRVIWVLGPNVDAAAYNDTLLAANRNLLPAPLGQPFTAPKALPLDWVDMHAGVFGDLFDSQDPFRTVLVTSRWTLQSPAGAPPAPRGIILGKLADDSPLLLQHSSNGTTPGHIYTFLTTPTAAWSNLGGTVLLVPLASRMALGDFQELGPTSYQEGDAVTLTLPNLAAGVSPPSLDVTTPDGAVINVRPAGNDPHWYFDHAYASGLYRWRSADGKHDGQFVVNPPAEEVDLLSADVAALAKESADAPAAPADSGKATLIAGSVPELLAQLERRSEGASLTPGFLAMVLMLAVAEALMANRARGH